MKNSFLEKLKIFFHLFFIYLNKNYSFDSCSLQLHFLFFQCETDSTYPNLFLYFQLQNFARELLNNVNHQIQSKLNLFLFFIIQILEIKDICNLLEIAWKEEWIFFVYFLRKLNIFCLLFQFQRMSHINYSLRFMFDYNKIWIFKL